jgi:translation elongation factor P/translation initiation factor 5A
MDTNTLYLVLGGFVAVLFVIGMVNSDVFKAKVTKRGLDIAAGKHPEKDRTRIKNVKNKSDVEVTQKGGHHVEIEDIGESIVKVKK